MDIVFMGTPEFGVPTLQALIDSKHTVISVYAQPPRPAGRGQKLQKSPIQLLAEAHDIPVYTPVSLKNESMPKADIAVVAAYGLLLPKHVLEAFPKGCINIHPSLLPRWRGAAPIQRTILAGDKETSVCIMQMDAGLDTGDILMQENVTIAKNETSQSLHDRLSKIGASMVIETLETNPTPMPQSAEGVTYAKKITKQEAEADWNKSAEQLERDIRGLGSIYFTYQNELIKIHHANVNNQSHSHTPGTILERFHIACNQGILEPLIVQRAGKKPMPVEVFLQGFHAG